MLPGRRVTFYLGMGDEFTQVGTYYSDEWKVEEDSQWAKVSCIDKLFSLQSRQYPGFTLQSNVSLYTIAKDIALAGGFKENEIGISNALKSIIIPKDYQVYEDQHEAIIDEEIWEAAQAKKRANGGRRETIDKDHQYIYSALVKCPICGKSLYGVPMRNRKKRKDETFYPTYYAYGCRSNLHYNGIKCGYGQDFRKYKAEKWL